MKIGDIKGWAFALHGFRIIAKLDRRLLPPIFRLVVVNGSTKLNGAYVSYRSTPEGKAMIEMKKAELARLARRKISIGAA